MALEGYETYACSNWDGYGGEPITAETLAVARAIVALLSQPPETAPGGDGTIGFEWVDSERGHKIFMDVTADSLSIYAWIGTKTLQAPSPSGQEERGK